MYLQLIVLTNINFQILIHFIILFTFYKTKFINLF